MLWSHWPLHMLDIHMACYYTHAHACVEHVYAYKITIQDLKAISSAVRMKSSSKILDEIVKRIKAYEILQFEMEETKENEEEWVQL